MIGPHRGGNLIGFRCRASGRRGVVGTSAPEAAWVGRDILRAGGNAFDAAVAAALAETVLLPSKCGLAGDLVALVRHADGTVRALTAIGPAPAQLAGAVAARGLPLTGGLAVGVPAAPLGYAELAGLGQLPLADLVSPAIDIATTGMSWSPINYDYTVRSLAALRAENPGGVVFLPDDQPISPGTWVTLPGHAGVLRAFAEVGGALFHGDLGAVLVDTVAARGGVVTAADLTAARAQWAPAVHTELRGRDLWVTPTPTHGPALLEALTAFEAELGCRSSQIERVSKARQRQRDSLGDQPVDGGTSIVTAADADGNAVVLVHSLSHPTFGSGLVVPELDIVLSNRAGRGFTVDPGHPNAPAAGRRPITTLHAWALGAHGDAPFTAGATSGGVHQMPWNVQVVERFLADSDPAGAVLGPLWSLSPSDGELRCETEGSPVADDGVVALPALSMESGIQMVQTPDGAGVCHVVTDIRCVGGVAAV
ncbi:gamma-glutamyltranspeptidase [Mycolicibacterium chitae]|uniref:Gamma-glutamyltransferase 1 Threonine peptidase MEROPS family T03 n=1 Tax=Mycolicibacterium chitae TaxID=1792 RepID=A0A3S4S5I2_MYCCI|nr:gamma-glutamyltransferase [Mycolicibacterium chitae]MCV7107109.1 gamma-glutamyltransferase [Mycolicibacterium chitae]BBZ02625.1 gamma-glutamyltranspeptidase [Mycolicibacterium chitae]VEG45364.1 Gamma-glutamyltransferase 1 Threonine peptidase MEROPS family T03 [Mycolicibacterium chitae]